ncbi:hypothetical protein [Antrihabitans sp. YC2-6]|uniref:hypothetical protein n=1 Tax=Antrihabitans sp. YC2-6 TaxID=2799498 RepID=UPI0018F75AC1|nr:hypothetical protein [Antrihabitans sp. YC2-6]MBJ8348897.1 hypothetical protein [Antrihabitans sp. YC2-6]
MKTRNIVAGAAFVMFAVASGTGIASAVPSIGYQPNDNPSTPGVNEAGTVETHMSSSDVNAVANSPYLPYTPLGAGIAAAQQMGNDCYTVNSSSLTNHAIQGYDADENGNC